MGTTSIVNPTMSPLSIILLAVASLASADVTCDECVTSMGALVARLTSEESIAEQIAILTGTVCPGSADPDACNEGLPQAWPGIAAAMYPEFLRVTLSVETLWAAWFVTGLARSAREEFLQ